MRILGSIVLFFSLFLCLTTHAQISIGIKGGPDFSKFINAVQGDDGNGNISRLNSGTNTGFYGSVFVDIPLDSGKRHMFYLRPAVEYIGAGGKMNPDGDYYNANGFQPNTKYTLHYVDVPVEFVFSPNFDWGRPVVGLGLYAGALVNGTIKTAGSSSQSVLIGNAVTDNFQRVDFGYTFTIGLATKVGFMFGVDYQHGFLQVVPTNSTSQSNAPRMNTRNSIWGLHLGWIFKL
jgi:hypothetical protein